MSSVHSTIWRRFTVLAALTCLLWLSGCGGGRYPVTGRVTFDDGSPLDAGAVICETQLDGKTIMARATLRPDGTFALGTTNPEDGAPPGKYRVLVVPRALYESEKSTKQPPIDPKFEKFESSGLSLEVKPGGNELLITVTKPKQWTRQKAEKAD
jgi:hypothetical protein